MRSFQLVVRPFFFCGHYGDRGKRSSKAKKDEGKRKKEKTNEFVFVVFQDIRFHDYPSLLPIFDHIVSHFHEEALLADLVLVLLFFRSSGSFFFFFLNEEDENEQKNRG